MIEYKHKYSFLVYYMENKVSYVRNVYMPFHEVFYKSSLEIHYVEIQLSLCNTCSL